MYKLAVYTICKDEFHNVRGYLEAASAADYICILDTGSKDGTWEELQKAAAEDAWKGKLIIAQKVYKPWRFDAPRNDNLAMIPADAAISWQVDMDERIQGDAIAQIKAVWKPQTKMVWYKYAWKLDNNGNPLTVFWYNKIHSPTDWYWKYPVHEMLYTKSGQNFNSDSYVYIDKIFVKHYPVAKQSRTSYLPLLELRYKENPNDDMTIAYLEHQYLYEGKLKECIDFALNRAIPFYEKKGDKLMWSDAYYFAGWAYDTMNDVVNAEKCYLKGKEIYPIYRNNWFKLGQLYMKLRRYEDAYTVFLEMLGKSARLYSWLELLDCFSWEPYDLISLALYYGGKRTESLNMAKAALAMCDPKNSNYNRLKTNVEVIEVILKK